MPPALGATAIRDLARRHGIRPTKSLGQNFLIDPNLARAIVADAGIGPGDPVIEVGAGFGSLTVALASAGAHVLAIEFDRGLIPALEEVTSGMDGVHVLHADAMKLDWPAVLACEVGEAGAPWTLCANLPYNVAVPVVMESLERGTTITREVVMVQREVGERLAAGPGDDQYGAVSVRVAYRARASVVRKVASSVFWPRPSVDSVVVRLDRLAVPPVSVDEATLWKVVEVAFAERRKTMRNAVRRLGIDASAADDILREAGVAPASRPEELDIAAFAAIAERIPA
ncbi:MAG TPA: 16S rRNA (adenine(1518)-N(6)/adenine(1519)-N(6))-dimethyltransferase RsmA [Actinomycetota bacterium]